MYLTSIKEVPMKHFLLSLLLFSTALCYGQESVNELPAGKYETVIKNSQHKWERGDIILIDESHYKMSTSNDVGEYKFSMIAQRVFFTSGPLKNIFAKTTLQNNAPVIVVPAAENSQAGVRSEILCSLKQ